MGVIYFNKNYKFVVLGLIRAFHEFFLDCIEQVGLRIWMGHSFLF